MLQNAKNKEVIYKLQRIVTLSASFYVCAFVIAILLCNVCDVGLLHMYDFFVHLDFFYSDFGYFSCHA